MATELYLDTARFGRMRLLAQEAERDFAHLCGEEGGSVVIEELLVSGYQGWPDSMRRRYPGLAPWHGVGGLKRSARALIGTHEEPEVMLAGRSRPLMRLAARALFSRCCRILHTDLEWPAYAAILREEGGRCGGRVWSAEAEELIRTERLGRQEVIDLIAGAYRRLGCDGLFLSAVSYRGVRLPIDGVLEVLDGPDAPRFVLIDGAQALGHLPWDIRGSDIVLGGAHKRLRSGHPLGLAYACTPRARHALRDAAGDAGHSDMGDPLYALVGQLEAEHLEPLGETADLSGLFCAAAALSAEAREPRDSACRFEERLANSVALEEAAEGTGWRADVPGSRLRTGILLFRNDAAEIGNAPPERMRESFQRRGVALTAYPGGVIRLSMPYVHWLDDDLDHLRSALNLCH